MGEGQREALEARKQRDVAEKYGTETVSLTHPQPKTPKFREMMGSEMVDIYVGEEKEHFRIHRSILCNKVPYFQKMFSIGFVEGSELKAYLPEDDPEDFDVFAGWVYFGTLRALQDDETREENWRPINLYILADKFCLPELMDQVIDAYLDELQNNRFLPDIDEIEMAYELTPTGSTLRRFMCAAMHYIFAALRTAEKASNDWPSMDVAALMKSHQDFTVDFLNMMRTQPAGVAPEDPRWLPKCEFHCHGKDEPCPQKARK
ncbi:hypothetical protein DSL72_000964 [Monilinia vaccinii-corymbosi]|uniref:BTB domain-containing protein n=1 Tax=Monilinia vaccinii-corymbosi TaxID=61207 RepID=A0A8A3P9U9_9HELO|nr:hypothetical protein DSL72_000964 [Monilinia vaccinii-corymbosi]